MLPIKTECLDPSQRPASITQPAPASEAAAGSTRFEFAGVRCSPRFSGVRTAASEAKQSTRSKHECTAGNCTEFAERRENRAGIFAGLTIGSTPLGEQPQVVSAFQRPAAR